MLLRSFIINKIDSKLKAGEAGLNLQFVNPRGESVRGCYVFPAKTTCSVVVRSRHLESGVDPGNEVGVGGGPGGATKWS